MEHFMSTPPSYDLWWHQRRKPNWAPSSTIVRGVVHVRVGHFVTPLKHMYDKYD